MQSFLKRTIINSYFIIIVYLITTEVCLVVRTDEILSTLCCNVSTRVSEIMLLFTLFETT